MTQRRGPASRPPLPTGSAAYRKPPARAEEFPRLLASALERRESLLKAGNTDAARLFGGAADGMDGVYVDCLGPGCVLILYEGRVPEDLDATVAAHQVLEATAHLGVRAVYLKPFARDRSRLGGQAPPVLTDPSPTAGEPLDEAILVHEYSNKFEVRLYDGFSTGLFIDQRENRRFLAQAIRTRRPSRKKLEEAGGGAAAPSTRVLNMFAYTGAFSIACAAAGAQTTSVDISGKYLDWAKRNFEHNGLDHAQHRFAKMDAFEFFTYAKRKALSYDLIILDPPSFSTANKRKKIPAWSSTEHFAKLIQEARGVLAPGGAIFASTNTREMCLPGRLERDIEKGFGTRPRWIELPAPPVDFAREKERFAARMFTAE